MSSTLCAYVHAENEGNDELGSSQKYTEYTEQFTGIDESIIYVLYR